ncbi:hypothetical protein KW492_11025 [Vibrio fluvialis]|nr:hypothetical protein [Vibrio fluvialis]
MKQFDKREILGGLVVLFVGVLIGSFWLSDIASPAVGFFTSIGSIATAFTLGFLVWQNSQQAKRLDKQEEHQQTMWKEQREMLTFQKLQMHKSLFNDLLNELEVNHGVKFYNRTELYKNIFPDNNFSKFSAQVLPQSIVDAQAGSLQDSKTIYEKIMNRQADYDAIQSSNFVHSHLNDLWQFFGLLHLTFPNKNNFGDITYKFCSKDFLIMNIFDLDKTLYVCEEVLQHLCDFSGLEHKPIKTNTGSAFYTKALFNYFFLQINHREFTINLGQVRGSFNEIYRLITELPKDREFQDSAASSVASFLNLILNNEFADLSEKEAIKKLLPQTRYLHELLEEDYNSGHLPNKKQDATLSRLGSCNVRLAARLKLLEYLKTKK